MPPTGVSEDGSAGSANIMRSLARTVGAAVIGCTLGRVVADSDAGPFAVNSGLLVAEPPNATSQSASLALVRSNFHRLPWLSPA